MNWNEALNKTSFSFINDQLGAFYLKIIERQIYGKRIFIGHLFCY